MTSRPPIGLLAETALLLVVASARLRLQSFDTLAASLRDLSGQRTVSPDTARLVERALKAWSRRLPWHPACFEQGLAACWWLRRRGYAARLHYGARRDVARLEAHVWITSGETVVVGGDNAGDFVELRQFP